MSEYRYPWPASALSPDEMRMLYLARESHPQHPPITRLIAEAVRAVYRTNPITPKEPNNETIDPEK